jgi:hypothetical protein
MREEGEPAQHDEAPDQAGAYREQKHLEHAALDERILQERQHGKNLQRIGIVRKHGRRGRGWSAAMILHRLARLNR